jgi:hypothetical protein
VARVDVSTKAGGRTTSTREKKSSLPFSFKIIAGSYERLLYGLEGTTSVSVGKMGAHGKNEWDSSGCGQTREGAWKYLQVLILL